MIIPTLFWIAVIILTSVFLFVAWLTTKAGYITYKFPTPILSGIRKKGLHERDSFALEVVLCELLKFDLAALYELLLCEQENARADIREVKKRIEEHVTALTRLLENKLTLEEKAILFETCDEDWHLCKRISLKKSNKRVNKNNNVVYGK